MVVTYLLFAYNDLLFWMLQRLHLHRYILQKERFHDSGRITILIVYETKSRLFIGAQQNILTSPT